MASPVILVHEIPIGDGMVNINISLPPDVHTKLKLAAALHDASLKDYLSSLLDDSVRNVRGEQPTAKAPADDKGR